MEEKEYRSDTGTFAIGMTKKEIRALCHWASIGISKAKGGTYENITPQIIEYFANKLKFSLPCKPEFNSKWKKYYKEKVKRERKFSH